MLASSELFSLQSEFPQSGVADPDPWKVKGVRTLPPNQVICGTLLCVLWTQLVFAPQAPLSLLWLHLAFGSCPCLLSPSLFRSSSPFLLHTPQDLDDSGELSTALLNSEPGFRPRFPWTTSAIALLYYRMVLEAQTAVCPAFYKWCLVWSLALVRNKPALSNEELFSSFFLEKSKPLLSCHGLSLQDRKVGAALWGWGYSRPLHGQSPAHKSLCRSNWRFSVSFPSLSARGSVYWPSLSTSSYTVDLTVSM
jgi:hypothetical protein